MIVDTMSMEEVGNALMKTVRANIENITRVVYSMDKVYRRVILKGGNKRYDFKPLIKEVDGIEFHVCPYSRSKRHYKRYGIMYGLFAHFFYKGTNWYAMLCGCGDAVALYSQHFFKRYIERHLKDGSSVSIDTVRHYFKETDYLTNCKVIENPKYPNCIYGATNIGVCCGYHVNGRVINVWNTYIDRETLTGGEKKSIFEEYSDRFMLINREEYYSRLLDELATIDFKTCA